MTSTEVKQEARTIMGDTNASESVRRLAQLVISLAEALEEHGDAQCSVGHSRAVERLERVVTSLPAE